MSGLFAYAVTLVIVLIGFAAVLWSPWFAVQPWRIWLRLTWPWWLGAIVVVWAAALWMSLNAPQPAPLTAGWLRADNLNGIYITQGWGSPGFGRSVGGNPFQIGKERFQYGIGTHAEGVIRLQVPPGAVEFGSQVGLDAEEGGGQVEFEVLADGESVWKSGPVGDGVPAITLRVPVSGRHELKLLTHALGDDAHDHGDWVNPAFRIDPQTATAAK